MEYQTGAAPDNQYRNLKVVFQYLDQLLEKKDEIIQHNSMGYKFSENK